MLKIVLTRLELYELSGRKRPSAVCRWLDAQRIPYIVGADGWPRVFESSILDLVAAKIRVSEPKLNLL